MNGTDIEAPPTVFVLLETNHCIMQVISFIFTPSAGDH